MAELVNSGHEGLLKIQDNVEAAVEFEVAGFEEVAEAKKTQARGWKVKAAVVAAPIGAVLGVPFGPAGMAAGAALGGFAAGAGAKVVEGQAVRTIDTAVQKVQSREDDLLSNCQRTVVTERIYENQRWSSMSRRWGHEFLTSMDVGAWSNANGVALKAEDFMPGAGWRWCSEQWEIDNERTTVDNDGWEYAYDWPGGTLAGSSQWGIERWNSHVRRRRWHRKKEYEVAENAEMQFIGEEELLAEHSPKDQDELPSDSEVIKELQQELLRQLNIALEGSSTILSRFGQDWELIKATAGHLNFGKFLQSEMSRILAVRVWAPMGGIRSGLHTQDVVDISKLRGQSSLDNKELVQRVEMSSGIFSQIEAVIADIQSQQQQIVQEADAQTECLEEIMKSVQSSQARIQQLEKMVAAFQ